jgi:hypothetical protein
MCEYAREVKNCLAELVEEEQTFSAWVVTKAVRAAVGSDVNVSHDEVKGMVHVLMEGNPDYNLQFNGKFVEYIPAAVAVEDDVLDDDELLKLDKAEDAVAQMRLKTLPDGVEVNFLDREHLVFLGEVVTLRFDRPVSVVEVRAG